ncbi:MAG TPA: EAL domain-containing protein [Acidimicrobiales bacterium]|nr:EAL domain-containing protein [Acidimicrobiales bacterium]
MNAAPEALRVLLVEDSPGDAALVKAALAEGAPHAYLRWVPTLAQADALLHTAPWSCVLLDLGLPDGTGVEALDVALSAAVDTPVVVLTGNDDEAAGHAAVAAGAQDYLVKGQVSPALVVRAVEYAVERHRLGRELQLLLDSAGEGVFATDIDGVCTFVNRAACDMLGYKPAEILGRSLHDLVHHTKRDGTPYPRGECRIHQAMLDGQELRIDHELLYPKDGPPFEAELSCAPLADNGSIKGAVVSFSDVTARLQVEDALRASEARYRTIVETAEEGIWLLDNQGVTTFVNTTMALILGRDPSEIVGTPAAEYLGSATIGWDEQRVEARLMRGDGEEVWAFLATSPTYDEAGERTGILAMVSDITARRQAEQGLRRLAAIVEHSNDAILSLDLDGNVLSWNSAAERTFGFEADAMIGRSVQAIIPPERAHELDYVLSEVRRGRSVEHLETVQLRSDGRKLDASITASPTRDADGTLVGVSVIARDITERKRAMTALAVQTEVLAMVAQGRPLRETLDAVIGIVEGELSEYTCEITLDDEGRTADEGDGTGWSVAVRGERENRVLGAITVRHAGDEAPSSVVMARAELGARLVAIAVERTRFEERLVHQALHDALTALPNRTLFMDRLRNALARGVRGGVATAVLFLDLDRFKVVNDSLGHAAGDTLLQQVGERLRRVLRPGDTIARLGGDEFAVLCEDLSDQRQVAEVANRVQRVLDQSFVIDGAEVHVSGSIGIALATDPDATPESLLRDADAAMYRAKDRGRARYEVFDQALRTQAMRRLDIENALRRAVDGNELRVHYQPEVDLITGVVTGAEGLVRWQHPEQGLLLPGAFIPVAEETGLIVPLGMWVLEEACRQRRAWTDAHPEWPALGISVNISARQLAGSELPEQVAAVLARHGVPPAALCLEITETVLMDDVEVVSVALDALRRLGVRVAVDDFGTGYSSLVYLKRFPVRRLKVDRRFVDGLGHDPDDAAIVAGVVSLAHALGLEAVAEGVERPEQLAALRATECDLAQGFHWSAPLPASEFEQWMSANGTSWATPGALGHDNSRARTLAAAAGSEASVLQAAGEARAALASARTKADAVAALSALVHNLGGTVVKASAGDPRAIPVDLSFGLGEPLLPACDSFSVARMHLIRLLPVMVEEAEAALRR